MASSSPDGHVQRSPFITISLDVLMMICDHLSIHNRISLALTEKCMLQALFPLGIPKLESKLKMRLLLLLEKDLPSQFCCFDCSRLCYFKVNATFGLDRKCSARRWSPPYNMVPGAAAMAIPFTTARLVMLREQQGGLSGLPKSFLTRHYVHTLSFFYVQGRLKLLPVATYFPGGKWTIAHRQLAKIINGELYIQRCHSLNGPRASLNTFKRALRLLCLPVCNHLVSYRWWDSESLAHTLGSNDPICHQHSGSCPTCYTDYSITVAGNSPKAGWTLLLDTYHRLGSCSNPRSSAWKELTRPTPINEVIYFDDTYFFESHDKINRYLRSEEDSSYGEIEAQWREAAHKQPLGGTDSPRKVTGWAFGCLGVFHLYQKLDTPEEGRPTPDIPLL